MSALSSRTMIYGKHRAFGDFIAHGLPHSHLAPLDSWLEAQLPVLRAQLGDNWEMVWAAAPPLYFWIGPNILGVPLLGVFIPSADKVGRRFPLIFGLTDVVTPPPVADGFEAGPYEALWSHIVEFRMPERGLQGGEGLLQGFVMPQLHGTPWESGSDGTLWGQREDGNLMRLFADARSQDAIQAQFTRSHWWHPGHDAGWLACNGLPDASALAWLLDQQTKRRGDGQ